MTGLNSKLPRGVDLPMPVGSDAAKMFQGPKTLNDRDQWRRELADWKADAAQRIHYDGSVYENSQLASIDSFNVALVWLWDELLFDFQKQQFTPERFIADSAKFGGLDGIILWHAYPVIGIDSRNQFDFYNEVPGLGKLITDFQNKGIKVYLNYNPWDRWTSRPENLDQNELAELIRKFNFDGVFLDTMKSADPEFMAPILAVNPHIIVAGESRVQQERICDHVMSWAQWFGDSDIPGVIRAKWFEPRHMLHQTRRWNRSHIEELHIAWLNGAGMLLWEVVFGSWVGWNEREMRMWKEMVALLRAKNELITKGSWEPLTKLSDEAEAHLVYASRFSLREDSLLTIINKNDSPFEGEILPGIKVNIPAKGVAALLGVRDSYQEFKFSYEGLSDSFLPRQNVRLGVSEGIQTPLNITFRNRECGLYDGAPFVDAWKPLPPNFHQVFSQDRVGYVRPGKLEKREVSNQEFFEFISETKYEPKERNRFLAHWKNGSPLPEDLSKPVVYIDLEDAKAFADWKGSSLPNEWEWQVYFGDKESGNEVWNMTDSLHTDDRTRYMLLKGGSSFNVRNGQGEKSTSGIAESDWYVDGGVKDPSWVEKLLVMGLGLSRSENIGFICFEPKGSN